MSQRIGHRPASRRRQARAFTLIELLVSMTLMTILTGVVVFAFVQAQEIFVKLDAKVQVYQNVRYTFDQMERDIANMVKTADMEFHNDPINKGHYDPGEEITDPFGTFDFAATIRQPAEYTSADPKDGGRLHRHDSFYFRTVSVVEGRTKEVLVEYFLIGTDKVRPRLMRRVFDIVSVNADGTLVPRLPPIEDEMCLYVMDFKVEYYFDSKRTPQISGEFFDAKDAVVPTSGNFIDSPVIPYKTITSGGTEVSTFYQNGARPVPPATDTRGLIQMTDGFFRTNDRVDLGALEPGDSIYLFNADNPQFPTRDYTIKRIFETSPGSNRWLFEFREPVDVTGLTKDINLSYRAAWLPAAFRITLKIKDAQAQELRTVTRVFKVLGA